MRLSSAERRCTLRTGTLRTAGPRQHHAHAMGTRWSRTEEGADRARPRPGSRTVRWGVACALLLVASRAHGTGFVSTDPTQVAAFQAGATVLGFDEMTGTGVAPGVAIPAESRLTNQFAGSSAVFSSTAGPVAVISWPIDARSDPNLIGGSQLVSDVPVVDYLQPIQIGFIAPGTSGAGVTDRVGAWNDPTGSRIRLTVFDASGTPLESVEADEGVFLGISRPGIASATFGYVSTQSAAGFTLDDLTFAPPAAVLVPVLSPGGTALLWLALLAAALALREH